MMASPNRIPNAPPASRTEVGGKAGTGVRVASARALAQVIGNGRSLADTMPPALASVVARDRGLLQELCYGTLRWYHQLHFLLEQLLRKPLNSKEHELLALLLMGLYQLLHTRVPAYAAVSTTVAAVRRIGKPWAVGLSNAALRNFQRRRETLLRELDLDAALSTSHPRWLLDCLKKDWPRSWLGIAEANNARPPQCLRVNLRRTTRAAYLQTLAAAGIDAVPALHVPTGVVLETACDVDVLPGFKEGLVSVQDSAGQLAAVLLDLRPGLRVLDACAAPGSKTCHILEAEPGLARMCALDLDGKRLGRVRDNLGRLGLDARVIEGDASAPEVWWDGACFDRILLDAPCSATGVIRRHPDIKLLRSLSDIERLAERQYAMMVRLWPLLAPGGMLLYATCSVLKREDEHNIERFLAVQRDAHALPIIAAWGRAGSSGRQILPPETGMDGFFYACLVKNHND